MAFMGYNNWYKGLQMLADSLDLLTPEVLGRIHLHVYALEGQQMESQFRTMEPRLGGLTIRHGYRYEEIPSLLAGVDLGLVTSVWWDNAPQTVMEFAACGIPVLAAALGGIPDFVRDGENGLLFRGNDRWDLARVLAWITRNPGEIARLRTGVHPPKDMAEHAIELEQMYGERIS
jgi:glycosyltransferase involved in cell wall biosynthesis